MEKKHTSMVKDNFLYEMVFDKQRGETKFAYLALDGQVSYVDSITTLSKEVCMPLKANSNLLKTGMILFPSKCEEYGTEEELLNKIRQFVNKRLELSEFMQQIVPYYILFTWIYDNFHEVPYLRVLGDYGTGKSRFLKIVGSLCYKPMFTIGATSDASVFRIIDQINGTLVIDEADIKYSNAENTLVQIFNSGYQKGLPICRCLDGKGGNFDVVPYQVFGPKILASRYPFEDQALESRCLAERMGRMKRTDIQTNLSHDYEVEADELRNMLLLWRLRNYGKRESKDLSQLIVEPRLKQIISPLSAVIENEEALNDLKQHIKNYNQDLINDRGLTLESNVFESILAVRNDNSGQDISLGQVLLNYNSTKSGEAKITPKKLGGVIKHLGLSTYRKNIGFAINMMHAEQEIPSLCAKFGIDSAQVNVVNNAPQGLNEELQGMGLV